ALRARKAEDEAEDRYTWHGYGGLECHSAARALLADAKQIERRAGKWGVSPPYWFMLNWPQVERFPRTPTLEERWLKSLLTPDPEERWREWMTPPRMPLLPQPMPPSTPPQFSISPDWLNGVRIW